MDCKCTVSKTSSKKYKIPKAENTVYEKKMTIKETNMKYTITTQDIQTHN